MAKNIIQNLREFDLLILASHNQDTVDFVKKIVQETPEIQDKVRFGQLKGFSDQITEELVKSNLKVYKYLPYGPTEVVMPYLVRRGQESKQVVREQVY